MELYYLKNSSFALLWAGNLLVFDYFEHQPGKGFSDGFLDEKALARFSKIYFFASHRHHDHFNPLIFDFAKIRGDIVYLLDAGILHVPKGVQAHRLGRADEYQDAFLRVIPGPSTDLGCCFQIEAAGKTIFHAGDLNCWHWKGQWSVFEERQARNHFSHALGQIKQTMGAPFLAFFPVDPRLGPGFDDGAVEFLHAFHPEWLVPMHFQGDDAAVSAFLARAKGQAKFWAPRHPGESHVF